MSRRMVRAALPENGRSRNRGTSSPGIPAFCRAGETAPVNASIAPLLRKMDSAAIMAHMEGRVLYSMGSASSAPDIKAEYTSAFFI